jgi:hypothetical protein
MSLLTANISRVRKLSLREVRLPAPERRTITPPNQVEREPTREEIAYSRIVAKYPKVGELKTRLRLVIDTPPEIDRLPLLTLAGETLQPCRSYTRGEILSLLQESKKVTKERAERGFSLLLLAGIIEPTIDRSLFYLTSSTPF